MKKTKKRFDAFKEEREETEAMISSLTTHNSKLKTPKSPSDAATAKQLMDQYQIAVAADVEAARQKLKFGAMLALWANAIGCVAGLNAWA